MVRFLKGSASDHDGGSDGLTVDGRWEGTPTYMAPEQVEQRATIDGRADLYALALVGYFLITGKDVFKRDTPVASIMAQVKDDPPLLAELTDRPVPEAFEALLRSCLAKAPDDRPADLVAFAAELEVITFDGTDAWSPSERAAWWAGIPIVDYAADITGEGKAMALHKQEVAAANTPAPSSTSAGDATVAL
jgi:serine/threonine protein kinase